MNFGLLLSGQRRDMDIKLCHEEFLTRRCYFCCRNHIEKLGEVHGAPSFLGCTEKPSSEDTFVSFSLCICPDCGLIQTDAEALETTYAEVHSEALGPTWEAHHHAFSQFIEHHTKKNLAAISLLELGASVNPIARRLSCHKNKKFYIDPIHFPPFDLKENEQYLSGFFPQIKPDEKVDIIIASHVLEHIPQTFDFFKKSLETLLPNGSIFISVPYFELWIKNHFFNAISAEHVVYPFLNQFQRLGNFFSCSVEVEYFKDHSLFVVFRKKETIDEKREVNSLDYLYGKKLLLDWIFQFNKSVSINLPQKEVALFIVGASHLSQYFLLCNTLLESGVVGVLDNSARKWGKRLYGTKIRAASFEKIREYAAPFIFLPPSPYAEEMKQQILKIAPQAEIALL